MSTDNAAKQESVRQALTDAGYTNVTIVEAAYLVRATSPNNESVMMIIESEDAMPGSTMGTDSSSSSTGTMGTDSSSMSSDTMEQSDGAIDSGSSTGSSTGTSTSTQ